ncbi:MAG: hypothetical protein GXY32_08725 [Ruminococcaceae bacterium]|nr:hypothetical protein [Oscillospiraceae bacterium]
MALLNLITGIKAAVLPAALWYDRTIPQSGEGTQSGGAFDGLNLIFIVAFAIGISFLARFLARRGGRRK